MDAEMGCGGVLDAATESLCARLCLLTRWREDQPKPMQRPQVRRLIEKGALDGLVLRAVDDVDPQTLERARSLLTRGSEAYALLRAYRARGYRTLLPEDRNWPTALLPLGRRMPLFLFARGALSLLDGKRVAVAGSREIGLDTARFARRVGQTLANEGITMVCGGARGVDAAAQAGLLDAGGRLILVPAQPAERLLANARLHRALKEGRLLLLSDCLPDEGFSTGRALGRNHIIYALGHAALVLAAREGVGGSWHGATDCLRGGFAPVFVPEGNGENPDMDGCRALTALGAGTFSLDGTPLRTKLFEDLKHKEIQTKPKGENDE